MNRTLQTLIAGAALLGTTFAQSASAQVSYPQAVGSGENVEIGYGPGPHGNIVGGGAVVVSGSGENTELRHLDAASTQAPRAGLVPVTVGSGESAATVWVPAETDRTQLTLVGADGKLPTASEQAPRFLAWLFTNGSKQS